MLSKVYDGLFVPSNDAIFSGSSAKGVDSACAYYDLLKFGFKVSFFHLKYMQALLALQDLEQAGLISDLGVNLTEAFTAAANALEKQFFNATTNTLITWFGCASTSTSDPTVTNCSTFPSQNLANQVPFDIAFIPSYALAVKVLKASPPHAVMLDKLSSTYARLRDQSRHVYGEFKTNAVGIETVTPAVWLPFDRWKDVDMDDFAVREINQTGDWQMFHVHLDGKKKMEEFFWVQLLTSSLLVFTPTWKRTGGTLSQT
eukprot:m.143516 g.143516  ORF g.143516 m.143516 type:complete len:258 (-) comp24220_c0_seq5:674-1447(-)